MCTHAHMSHGQVEVGGQLFEPVLSLSLFPGLNSDIRFASQRLKPLGHLTGTVTTSVISLSEDIHLSFSGHSLGRRIAGILKAAYLVSVDLAKQLFPEPQPVCALTSRHFYLLCFFTNTLGHRLLCTFSFYGSELHC